MSGNSMLPISSRATRLNSLIINRPETLSKEQREICRAINREGLLDALFLLYDECSKDALKKRNKNIQDFAAKYRPIIRETKQLRVSLSDFDVKSQIGNGYFGEVHLVSEKATKDVYAMKTIKKALVGNCQVREERDIMVLGKKCEWITRLQYAFQSRENLYLVMEYLPGGDLLGLMIRQGAFDEELTRFYLAELALAIDALHNLGYVHRDIKPENCLLDRFGHLKLADFGSSMALNDDGSFVSISPVGTPNYVAPELLQILSSTLSAHDTTQQKLDPSCDYWSMGIIGFEMIAEKTPFQNENVYDTYSEIQKYSDEMRLMQVLEFPSDLKMSRKLKDLLNGLITKPRHRMTIDEIKDHPFFIGINWHSLRDQAPPIIPTLNGEDDTSNFDDIDILQKRLPVMKKSTFTSINLKDFSGEDLPFLGYTYVYEESSKFLKSTPKHSTSVQLESKLSNKIGDLQVTIKEQMKEIKILQKDLLNAEKKAEQMDSLEKLFGDTKEDIQSIKIEVKKKVAELATCKTEIKTLKSLLKIEEEMRSKSDASAAEVMSQTFQKWKKAKEASDQNYEKQLSEKKTEIKSLNDRIRAGEVELGSKINECQHLNATLEKYKDMLKMAKDQNVNDKNDYEKIRRTLTDSNEVKVQDLKIKLNSEKELRAKSEQVIKDLRKQHDEITRINKTLIDGREQLDMELSALRKQLGNQMDDSNRLTKDRKDLEKQLNEANQKNDDLRKEILKFQEDSLNRQLKLSKMISQPIQIGGRCSATDDNFKSAHGSLTELDIDFIDPEDLKSDLARAKENENIQRKRADHFELAVGKLEEMIEKLNATSQITVGGILEKRNEKLEDQLVSVREEAIVERQSARTANLQLWKLEKEVKDIKSERDGLIKRLERANQKSSDTTHEKESLELKIKQHLDTINAKETQIIDLQKDIRTIKYEMKQDRDKWSAGERSRLQEKTEIIEKTSKIKNLEEKLHEANNKLKLLELKVSKLTDEKEILQRRLHEEKSSHATDQEVLNELQIEYDQKSKNYEALIQAVVATESQLNKFEEMWSSEVNHNKKNTEKIDDLWSKVRSRDEEISKLRHELGQEKSLKISAESKGCQVQNEYDELKEEMQNMQQRMLDLQHQLVKKQEILYEAQENMEVTSSDLQHLQKLKANYESEINILKEESSRILTDLYRSKEEAKRLKMELKDSQLDFNEMQQEKEHINTILSELRSHSKERDIRMEATDAQQKKLIAYLHQRVDELQNKKKRTIADVLFGSNTTNTTSHPPQTPKSARKENIPPPKSENGKLKKVEDDLKRERERNQKLKENLLLTKLEIRKSASMKSPEKVTTRESTVESKEPTAPAEDSIRTITATVHAEPKRKLMHENFQRDSLNSSPKAHHFAMTIETASPSPNMPPTICISCEKFVLVGQPYWQCKECKFAVHRKCRGMVKGPCLQGEGERFTSSSETTSTSTTITLNNSRRSLNKKSILDDVDGIKPFDPTTTEDSSSIGSGSDLLMGGNYRGDFILNSARFGFGWVMTSTPKINAVYELTSNIILFGCSNGLYSYHVEDSKFVQIKGINNVNYFAIKPNLTKSIIIADNGENLFECDLRVLMNKSQQSGLLEPKLNLQPIDLSIANQCGDEKWHMVELHGNSEHLNEAIAIATTSSRMVILKYEAKMGRFKPVRSLDTVMPISDILFTQHSAIVACDKFFEVDLSSYVAEEFLDMSDLSLRPTKNWKPMNIIRINSREFLLCFNDCGIFVDEYGLRAREENLEWIQEPKEFYYKNFLLYIIHEESVQILKINNSTRKHEKDLLTDNNQSRTFVMIDGEKTFTHNGCIDQFCANITKNVVENGHVTQDLMKIDAEKAFKINLNRSLTSIISDSNTSLATLSTASSHSSVGADTIN